MTTTPSRRAAFAATCLSACLTIVACDNVLDVKPETFSGTTNYYQSPEQVDRAVLGAYSYLQTIYGAANVGPMWVLAEMRADNTTYEQNQTDRGLVLNETVDDFLTTSANTAVAWMWNNSYAAILQSSVILGRIEPVAYTDQAAKDGAIGEAKFLRALSDFNLVRLVGAVPLRLRETDSYAGAFTAQRTPVDSVYRQIVADAQDAIATLPARSALPAAQAGRATKGAASMLLADVYMTRKQRQEAATVLQKVLAMGHTLVTPYERVFDPAAKNGPESILEVQYAEGA